MMKVYFKNYNIKSWKQIELISFFYSAHFLLNTSILFIDVCEIVIDAAVCAWLISTWVKIETYHLICSFCVCFVLCVLLVRVLYSWLIDWDVFDDVFILHVLHVVYALRENLVFMISSFQFKLKLRCIWWLCC